MHNLLALTHAHPPIEAPRRVPPTCAAIKDGVRPSHLPPSPIPPQPYNVIMIGTNLSSAILSAALSLSGARVLHLEAAPHYGAADATLPPPLLLASLNLPAPSSPPPAAALDRRPRPILSSPQAPS